MKDFLPDEVLWRKKSPYPKTHNPEYLKTVSSLLREIINDAQSPILRIIEKNMLEDIINNSNDASYISAQARTPWYGQLMTIPQTIAYFVQIDYWLRKYKVNIV